MLATRQSIDPWMDWLRGGLAGFDSLSRKEDEDDERKLNMITPMDVLIASFFFVIIWAVITLVVDRIIHLERFRYARVRNESGS